MSYAPEAVAPDQPEGWAESAGGWQCLRCRREEAMDLAVDGGGAEGYAERRRALMEFELMRDPIASDIVIAKRLHCSTARVRPVRAHLRRAGKLPGTSDA